MSKGPVSDDEAKLEAAPWSDLVLVCAKRVKRSDRKGFRADLKDELKAGGHRRVKVVETGCLGICPKRGVALASLRMLGEGHVLVLPDRGPVGDAVALIAD